MAWVLEDEGLAKRLNELLGTLLEALLDELLDELLDARLAHGESGGFTARATPAPVQEASSKASTRMLGLDLWSGERVRIVAPELRSRGDRPDQDRSLINNLFFFRTRQRPIF
jgi:hypothetical protein